VKQSVDGWQLTVDGKKLKTVNWKAEASIEILAIMHIRRQPDYWKNRK